MLGVSHLRNRRVLSNGFASLGCENLQLMYSDGDKAFGTSAELCIDERSRIASDGIIVVSMEIMRPQSANGSLQKCIKGKIRITTRCLWLDKGKLLDALYKAAHAALTSCPVNSPLAHMERIVAEVLRKMVRKYSSKRPEVIAVAVENTVGVLAEDLQSRLTGKHDVGFGLPTFSQPSVRNIKSKPIKSISEVDSMDTTNTSRAIKEKDEVSEFELLPENDIVPDSELKTLSSTKQHDFWESFGLPSAAEIIGDASSSSAHGDQKVDTHEKSISTERSLVSPTSPSETSKTVKRNKWKPDEIKMLIKMRGELDNRFKKVKGRTILWEEISTFLMNHGIDRSPAQCKSLWASLVQKYEESKNDEKAQKNWPYTDSMHAILSSNKEVTK